MSDLYDKEVDILLKEGGQERLINQYKNISRRLDVISSENIHLKQVKKGYEDKIADLENIINHKLGNWDKLGITYREILDMKSENDELKQKTSDLESLMQKQDEFLEIKNVQIEELKQRIAELESKESAKPMRIEFHADNGENADMGQIWKPIDRVREYGNQTDFVETSEFTNEPKIVWIGTNWEKSCENCKHSDLDYIFDDEIGEEYPIYTCQKGNDVSLDFECKDFKECKPEPYKEEDTRCDNCEYLHKCLKECQAEDVPYIDCTTMQDKRKHIVVGNINCYKNKE